MGFQLNYSISKMKTFLLAFILFNIAAFGEEQLEKKETNSCTCIADFFMTIQGTNDTQALILDELPVTVMEIIDENGDGCIIYKELQRYTISYGLHDKYSFAGRHGACFLVTMTELLDGSTWTSLDGNNKLDGCINIDEIREAIKRVIHSKECTSMKGADNWKCYSQHYIDCPECPGRG